MTEKDFIDFMKKIGDYAFSKNIIIAIEPNAKIYGCNFITNSDEGYEIVKKINSNGVKLHLDIGCMYLEKENIHEKLKKYINDIYHIHFSAPHLDNLFNCKDINYSNTLDYLIEIGYANYVTIELLNKSIMDINRNIQLLLI